MPTADVDLVARCRSGDLDAFETLYRSHVTGVYSLTLRMLGNRADAEDLVQEIFLTAYRKLDGFRGQSALSTWLYRLGVNRCLDYLRSRAAREAKRTDALSREGVMNIASTTATRPAPSIDRLDLESAIAQLPEGYRAALVLHDVEGVSHREIATILGVTEGTSRSQVHKARLRVRELLARDVPTPDTHVAARRQA